MKPEGKQREMAKALAPYHIDVENALFTFPRKKGGEEIRAAACAHVTSLWDLICSLLAENDR